jgi:hypothetical protein
MKTEMRSKKMMRRGLSTSMISIVKIKCKWSIKKTRSLRVRTSKLLFNSKSTNSSL